MNKSNSDGFFAHLIVQKYTVIHYHNISTYCLMHAVMLCTSLCHLLQEKENSTIPTAKCLSAKLSVEVLNAFPLQNRGAFEDLEVMYPSGHMPLEITHTRMLWSKLLELFLCTVLSRMTQDLGSFAAHCGIKSMRVEGPTTTQFHRRIRNPCTDLEIWCDVSVKGWEKKQFSSNPWDTSIFIAIRISACAFSTSRQLVAFQRYDTMVQQRKQKHHLLLGNTPSRDLATSILWPI